MVSKMINSKEKLDIIKNLRSEECICEKSKRKGFSFCYHCYQSLPNDMKKALYRKVNEGYIEAYEEAVKYLYENTL